VKYLDKSSIALFERSIAWNFQSKIN